MIDKQKRPQNKSNRKKKRAKAQANLWLYGRHAVAAAVTNPERKILRLIATKNARDWLQSQAFIEQPILDSTEEASPQEIDNILQAFNLNRSNGTSRGTTKPDIAHQGLVAQVEELPARPVSQLCHNPETNDIVLVLDQITDPQNIGAIFRSAAAFGARCIITQDRRTPPFSGALAKAAAGAIEHIPCARVVNIARALDELKQLGYYCAGLMGEGREDIGKIPSDCPVVIVLGAEGTGLRALVKEKCDALYRIPISEKVESLNVSTAAAIVSFSLRAQQSVHRSSRDATVSISADHSNIR
ncbi:MAG: 23S rRNA (guanosine(2251)-2'-O)-methyltransferase RlmB [Pseudomonadota bacterium]